MLDEVIKKTVLTLQTHLFGLLDYFANPITNAIAEGFNSKIKTLRADARGLRRIENYCCCIHFYCGQLDLRPAIS
jgi:transposase